MRRLIAPYAFSLLLAIPASAQSTPELAAELGKVNAAITAAEAEDAKYVSGLVKSLIRVQIETLKQTRAMLEQRRLARETGVTVRYTIDGKPFTGPANGKELIAGLDRELESAKMKVAAAENEVSKYSGGLVLSMALTTLATARQTQAMIEQRRLALLYEMPQYIGAPSSTNPPAPSGAAPSVTEDKSFEIIDVGSRVTEQNSTWWKYAWRVVVKNNGASRIAVRASVELLDSGGFIVDDGDSEATPVAPGETVAITGFELVTAAVAPNVAKTSAKVRRVQ